MNVQGRRILFVIYSSLSLSCSSEINLNQYLAQPYENNAVDLRSKAELLYDKGEFSKALAYAEKAKKLDPESEEGGVLLGAIHMGLAGIDSFQLIENLMSTEGSSLAEGNAASSLSSLSAIVSLDEAEYTSLTLENNEKDGVKGDPETGVFSELPVLLPKTASEARASVGETIYHIAQAIEALCPFVSDNVKILGVSGDVRHTDESCASIGEQRLKSRSHFNWAFAHLAEAILFNNVVLYAPSSDTPNLQARGTLIGQSDATSSVSEYVSAVQELAVVTDVIMPTDAEGAADSMLEAMFNDLEAAAMAFGTLSGVPDSVIGSLESSLNELSSQKDEIATTSGDSAGAQAMKNQLTESLASDLRTQIQAKSDAGELGESEKADLCAAYGSISNTDFSLCN